MSEPPVPPAPQPELKINKLKAFFFLPVLNELTVPPATARCDTCCRAGKDKRRDGGARPELGQNPDVGGDDTSESGERGEGGVGVRLEAVISLGGC